MANRAADARRRSMRLVYPDGEIEIDFLTRSVTNTTKRELQSLELRDPLWESVAAFVDRRPRLAPPRWSAPKKPAGRWKPRF